MFVLIKDCHSKKINTPLLNTLWYAIENYVTFHIWMQNFTLSSSDFNSLLISCKHLQWIGILHNKVDDEGPIWFENVAYSRLEAISIQSNWFTQRQTEEILISLANTGIMSSLKLLEIFDNEVSENDIENIWNLNGFESDTSLYENFRREYAKLISMSYSYVHFS